jgi:hypothetical protein
VTRRAALLGAWLCACGGGEHTSLDAATPDAGAHDARPEDATPLADSPSRLSDASLFADARPVDAGAPDAAPPDAAVPDAEPPDGAVPDGERVVVVFEGEVALDDMTPFTLAPPLGPEEALFLEARGAPDAVYQFTAVDDARGPRIGEPAGGAVSRTSANPETATALLPNTDAPFDAASALGGELRVQVRALGGGAGRVMLRALRVRRPAAALRVQVVVPSTAEFAGAADALVTFADALASRCTERFGVEVTVETTTLGPAAPTELFIESAAGDLGGFSTLAAALPEDLGPGLRLYLVDQIHDGVDRIGGLSGGLPAPASPGRGAAEVTAVRAKLLPDFPEAVADAGTHELGHALGLWHTTEPFGDRADPLEDTPTCPLVCDTNGDGALFARECGGRAEGEAPCRGTADNFMFWTLGGDWVATPGQRQVVRRHPAGTD